MPLRSVKRAFYSLVPRSGRAKVIDITEQVEARRDSLRSELGKTRSIQQEQLTALTRKQAAYEAELRVIAESIAGQKSRIALAEDTLARYRGLLEKDYIAGEQVQLREADLIDQRSRLQALERDRLNVQRELTLLGGELQRQPLEQSRELSELRRNISSTDQELAESELRRQVLILAPRDGVATAVTAEVGQSVDGSRPVVSIVPPDGRLQAHLFAPSKAVGFVREGEAVMLRFDGVESRHRVWLNGVEIGIGSGSRLAQGCAPSAAASARNASSPL